MGILWLLILNRTVCPQFPLENKDCLLPPIPGPDLESTQRGVGGKWEAVPMMKGH